MLWLRRMTLPRLLLWVSFPLFLLDFATKEWIVRHFVPPGEKMDGIQVIPGFFDIVRLHNRGVAFGVGHEGTHANWMFGGISLAAVGLLLFMWRKNTFPTRLGKTAVGLLLAGIAGNLLDRLLRGYVVDFLLFDLKFMVWPAFNVADSCICIAAACLFLSSFQKLPETKPDETPAS